MKGKRGPRGGGEVVTVLQQKLYAHPDGDISWLAGKLKVGRIVCGEWVRGKAKVPRRRQVQIRLHLEEPSTPLFDDRGVALRLDGATARTREEERAAPR